MFSMNTTQLIGIVAGVLTASSMLPQLIKTIKEKEAEDISVVMLLVLISGLSLWIFYGIKRDDMPLIITNGFSLLLNFAMVFLRYRYRK